MEWQEIRRRWALLEDEAVLALNKPAGISVMGERHETDLARLAEEEGETIFPVHRIDKVTSGVVLLAKELRFHAGLTRQFHQRTVDKAYLAIVDGRGLPERGVIELPLSAGRKGRVRVAAPRESIVADRQGAHGRWWVPQSRVFTHTRTYPSRSEFVRLWEGEERSVVLVWPITGRRHQIRIHLAWIGWAIVGDPLFASKSGPRAERAALHSWRLAFDASWLRERRVVVEAPPGEDFWAPVADRLDGDTAALLATAHEALGAQPPAMPPPGRTA